MDQATLNPPAQAAGGAARPSVISLAIREKAALYAAYMPFIQGGGLFVPTTRQANLGDDLASSRNSTPEMEEKTKRTTKVWRRCSQQLFTLLFRNLLFFCGLASSLFPFPRPTSATS